MFRKRCATCIYVYYNPRDLFPLEQCLKFKKETPTLFEGCTLADARTLADGCTLADDCRKDETKCGIKARYWFPKSP